MGRPTRLPPSAVDDAVDAGDRLDRLERARTEASTSSVVGGSSWVRWDYRPFPSGEVRTVGAVILPPGASKLTLAGTWKAGTGAAVEGISMGLSGIDSSGGGGGGPIVSAGNLWTSLVVGVVTVKRRTRAVVTVTGSTDDETDFDVVTGSVIVEPLPSII